MNQQSKDVVKKLVQIRKSSGVKADEMALVLDTSDEEYLKLERGIGEMTLSQMFRIAEVLRIEVGTLFHETEKAIHANISQGITEINFTITVKSQNPIDIESEIAKKFGLSKPTHEEIFTKKKGYR